MLRSSGAFTFSEINELVDVGCLNGLFVLARSIGCIGHYLDQERSDASGKSQWNLLSVGNRLGNTDFHDIYYKIECEGLMSLFERAGAAQDAVNHRARSA